jgi:ribosomal protein L20A (L18A)
MKPEDCVLFSGAASGAEAEFGAAAERRSIEEVNFTFDGHNDARRRGIRVLTQRELEQGDVSLAYVAKLMNRKYRDTPLFKKVLQSIWHQVNAGQEIYVVGKILDDETVKGGTGWGAEFAKLCNKPLYVFDQDRDAWFQWTGEAWEETTPTITHPHFTGTGTRFLEANGKNAIEALLQRSFS